MPRGRFPRRSPAGSKTTDEYRHRDQTVPMRPEVGTQAQFRKKKDPATYRYDSSLSPALDWDGGNGGARELGEWLLACIEEAAKLPAPQAFEKPRVFAAADGTIHVEVRSLQDAVDRLKRLGRPFLDWSSKAERLSFDVPTLPLFVHERLSTRAIVDTLVGHRADKQADMFDLFGDPRHSVTDQVLRAYEHQDKWVNRLVLGDSLVVMNSLLRYEGLGGQVQMIYIDPPYGVKFVSNFQPFVRKRDVSHNDDEDLTREPEMVKAYRDTWELGLHSYLTYMRDRLLLARDLLTPSGSVFVQISDENLHHVREVMDEVFGAENFVSVVSFKKTTTASGDLLAAVSYYLVWYARQHDKVKFRQVYLGKETEADAIYKYVRLPDGSERILAAEEIERPDLLPAGARPYALDNLTSQRATQGEDVRQFSWNGRTFTLEKGTFKTDEAGLKNLAAAHRLGVSGSTLRYKRFLDDFPAKTVSNLWTDTGTGSFTEPKVYAVQTSTKVIARCLLMTTDPGDLVLDPTCGSGTTAYVAEQWGRRWITIDTSRVPLALARQRLLTATFPYYQLKDAQRGPAGGFVYARKQNRKGEQIGGIVPHVTLKSIANGEPPEEEVLVDRPEEDKKIVRVTGPFAVEATIPTPVDWDADGVEDSGTGAAESYGSFVERMIERAAEMGLVPATYVQATLDLMMGDLLKNMRSSQIFSVCGLRDIEIRDAAPSAPSKAGDPPRFQVELKGLSAFDPTTIETQSWKGSDVPAWFLDADYNGLCFHVSQAFFPRTGAWQDLKKALKGGYDDSVWDHLAGTVSAPFEAGEHRQIAVKLLVVELLPGPLTIKKQHSR